jgi:hypothetical protein
MLGGSNLRADSWDAIAKTKSLLSYGSLESFANLTAKSEARTNGELNVGMTQENYLTFLIECYFGSRFFLKKFSKWYAIMHTLICHRPFLNP